MTSLGCYPQLPREWLSPGMARRRIIRNANPVNIKASRGMEERNSFGGLYFHEKYDVFLESFLYVWAQVKTH